jgi:hypothetical protein
MRRVDPGRLSELRDRESQDPVVATSADATRRLLSSISEPAGVASVELVVADFDGASKELLDSPYFTPVASSFPHQSLVVVNANMMRELTFVADAFDRYKVLADVPFLAGDDLMFQLVHAVRSITRGEAARTSNEGQASTMPPSTVVKQVELALRFIVGHEMGHLFAGGKGGSFGSLPGEEAPIDERIELAVTKLGRHVDDFARHGLDLPLWEDIVARSSRMRQPERTYAESLGHEYTNLSQWFADEEKADTWGEDLLRVSLQATAASDPLQAHFERYLMSKALFALGVGSWYRDLLELGEKLGEGPLTSSGIQSALLADRNNYIRLAGLFGEVHRFLLLRARNAIKRLFEEMPAELWVGPEERRVRYAGAWPPQTPSEDKAWLCSESLRHFWLLAMLMDTPIKIATVGVTMGWYRERIEAGGKPQLLFLNFEDIDDAWARVLEME